MPRFERDRRQVLPTAAGRELAARARVVLVRAEGRIDETRAYRRDT